jgi:hypothetical protein
MAEGDRPAADGFRAPGSSSTDAARDIEEILAHEDPTAAGD